MNDTTIIQVPTTKSFRDEMVQISIDMGFSSLQDLIRFNLNQIKNGLLVPRMVEVYPPTKLSPKAIARYNKIADDIDSGKEKTIRIDNTNDMIKYLDDHS